MQSERRRAAGYLCTALIILCGFAMLSSCKKSPPSDVSIRLKWLHQAQFAGFYYAKEARLYADKGVNVTLQPGGVDFPAIQMVASGSDQFGVTGADQILLAREKGIPVVAVAVIYRETPFVLFALQTSGIKRVEDMPGKKVGVKLGGNEELTYRAMVSKSGIDPTSVHEIPVKFDISPLLEGEVDVWPGYSINEPISAQEQGYQVNLIPPTQYGIHLYADVLFTTEEMIRTHPDVVRAVVQATVDGWGRALADRDSAILYTLRYGSQLTRSHELAMLNTSAPPIKPDTQPIGSMNMAAWGQMQTLLLQIKFMTKAVDLQQAFRTDFLPGEGR